MTATCRGGPEPLVYQRVEGPAALPVSLGRAIRHLRLDEADLDSVESDLIEAAIAAATEHLDGRAGILRLALLTQLWQATTDRPARAVRGAASGFALELGPLQAVTKVEYLTGGAYAVLPPASWRAIRTSSRRTVLIAAGGLPWPAVDRDPEAWRITFRVGYGDADDAVPAPIRSAMLLLIADLYDNRDGKVQANLVPNTTVDRLLWPYMPVEA